MEVKGVLVNYIFSEDFDKYTWKQDFAVLEYLYLVLHKWGYTVKPELADLLLAL